jgi:hypothetical protein
MDWQNNALAGSIYYRLTPHQKWARPIFCNFFLKELTDLDKISIDLSHERIFSIPFKMRLLVTSSGSLQLSDGHNDGCWTFLKNCNIHNFESCTYRTASRYVDSTLNGKKYALLLVCYKWHHIILDPIIPMPGTDLKITVKCRSQSDVF